MKIFIGLLIVVLMASGAEENVFLAQLTSEGARSPNGENIFKCDFKFGPNEITPMGLRQHYLVGSDLATNYASNLKLDNIYSPWQVNVRSTNHNMTLMAAQAELEAIFPPNTRPDLTANQAGLAVPPGDNGIIDSEIKALKNKIMPLNFQTLPIHAMDFHKDTVLMGEWCPEIYQKNEKNVKDSEWQKQIEEKYADALTKFRTFMEKDDLTIHQIYPHIDALNACSFNLDTFSKEIDSVKSQLLAFGFDYLEQYWSSEESRKIFVHGFFTDLQRYLEDAKKQYDDSNVDNYNKMKLGLYFGTVETTYVISRHLGFNHQQLPQFASQLLVHLNKDSEKGYLVSIEYNKELLKLGGECKDQTSCEYTSFNSFVSEIVAEANLLSSCSPPKHTLLLSENQSAQSNRSFTLHFIVAVSILGFISLIIGGFLGHKAAQHENKKRRIHVRESDPEALLS